MMKLIIIIVLQMSVYEFWGTTSYSALAGNVDLFLLAIYSVSRFDHSS